ncbi:MAG: hypothetical protein RRB13_12340 [bacterium]|nr:hypothetical protein [bacterium]
MGATEWIAIADPHLGARPGDLAAVTQLILSLDPARQELIFLGDLFHIWAGPERFHTDEVKALMATLWAFRERGGSSRLVVGNRDAFFKEVQVGEPPYQGLPFARIAQDFDRIETPQGLLLCTHGDLVNQEDRAYLRWRKVIRSRVFRWAFELMPKAWAKKLMFGLEAKLRESNLNYKMSFPTEQWENWTRQLAAQERPKLVLVGHFHPSEPIDQSIESGHAVVVPGWLEGCRYLKIHADLSYETLAAAN